MKKNFIGVLIFFLGLIFVACEKDLYEKAQSTGKIEVKTVKLSDVMNNAELMAALERQKLKPATVAGKVVFDDEYEFSINTDKVLYMQGQGFNSYTFLIEKEGIETVDNLVLMSQPGGLYGAFVVSYALTEEERDAVLYGTRTNITSKVESYGLNTSQIIGDIFSKEYYSESCSMEYSWEEVITVTPCAIDGCWEPEYIGESVSHVLVGTMECTGGTSTGSGNTSSQSGGGGGGGSIYTSDVATTPNLPELDNPPTIPCQKLRAIIKNPKVTPRITDLKGDLALRTENGFQFEIDPVDHHWSAISPTSVTQNSCTFPLSSNAVGSAHTHEHGPLNSPTPNFPMIDAGDLQSLCVYTNNYDPGSGDTPLYFVMIVVEGAVFAVKPKNPSVFKNRDNILYSRKHILTLNDMMEKKFMALVPPGGDNHDTNQDDLAREFLKFINNVDNVAGLPNFDVSLYRI